MKVEQIIAVDFANTADLDKCLEDPSYLAKCMAEWYADIDLDEVRTNLKMIQQTSLGA